jgi:transcriptional regulator GlxA family with amidase domain
MGIALLVEEGATASSVATTLDMFRLAQRFQPEGDFLLRLYSRRGGAVRLNDTLSVDTLPLPARFPAFEAVILPGFFAESPEAIDASLASTWDAVLQVLRALPDRTLVAASCYGTFTLGASGLLDGQSATTTWWLAQAFRQRYPKVHLDADQALVDSGRILTAGAMTAHTDLSLHLLRRLGGAALARSVGSIMLVDGTRGSQLPFVSLPRTFADPLLQKAAVWMGAHLAEAFSMEELAAAIHASYRTLHRRFQDQAGMAPLAYLHALRIDRAKNLLENGDEEFEAITERVGYEDPASFRRLFKRSTSLTPTQYRRQFKASSWPARP